MKKKIQVKDANGNGKLDWFDVAVYWLTLGLNTAITAGTIIQQIAR